ncbi:DUF1648 domain-containing protein [Amnibacterium flavum]|uniref:DUF1648 domain-containing protein n=1 Tax=Amnibacterium flavum TaxID=2173173 RepID=A0A2V1HN50_9MICO|nr:DUF1648 domain-containing protein [Amnibacterium flavum]PVZ94026.1 hypothetical protein DDQ50_09735 [Amnibacterium flavum]
MNARIAVASPAGVRRYRSRLVVLGALPPVLLVLGALAVVIAWTPSLPAEVAQHWNAAGRADGYGPAWAPALVGAAVVLIVAAGAVASGWSPIDAARSRGARVLLASAWGVSGLLSILQLGTLAPQLGGGVDAVQTLPVGALIGGFVGGLLLAVIGWFAAPRGLEQVQAGADGDTVPAVSLAPGQRAVWAGSTHAPLWLIVALTAAVVGMLVFALAVAASGDATAFALLLPGVVLAAALSTLFWRVRIDSRGVLVRSFLGAPRYWIPLSELDDVKVLPVSPVGDFGGWGLRFGPRRTGVVLHTGPGLQFERTTGRALVVTIDDAERAAGVGRALLAQAQTAK